MLGFSNEGTGAAVTPDATVATRMMMIVENRMLVKVKRSKKKNLKMMSVLPRRFRDLESAYKEAPGL